MQETGLKMARTQQAFQQKPGLSYGQLIILDSGLKKKHS
jgi:hypothetical protein